MTRKRFSEEQVIGILKEAEAMLDNAGLKNLLTKNGSACCQARSGRASPDDVGYAPASAVRLSAAARRTLVAEPDNSPAMPIT